MWDVGIIGAGNIGSAVARRLLALGHRVTMANARGPASLANREDLPGMIPGTVADAAAARDIVLLAVPQHAIPSLGRDAFARTPAETIVLDAGNYYPEVRDGRIAAIDAGQPDSAWVAAQIGRPVLKMFNTIHAPTIVGGGRPAGSAGRICLPIAGDGPAAKARAFTLADALGFDGLDAGPLAESWRQQPGMPAYCQDLDLTAMRAALAAVRIEDVVPLRTAAMDRARAWATTATAPGRLDG